MKNKISFVSFLFLGLLLFFSSASASYTFTLPTLRQGSSGAEVVQLQTFLNTGGYASKMGRHQTKHLPLCMVTSAMSSLMTSTSGGGCMALAVLHTSWTRRESNLLRDKTGIKLLHHVACMSLRFRCSIPNRKSLSN